MVDERRSGQRGAVGGQGRCEGAGTRPAWKVVVALAGLLVLLVPRPAAAQGVEHVALPDTMPGDRLLVSHRTPSGAFEVHTVNWDASERTVLTPAGAGGARWSPDGRYVAFHQVDHPGHAVYVASSDGATTTRVADDGSYPSWSPDSTRLVHSRGSTPDAANLHVTTLDGTSTPVPGTAGGVRPVWSPDGAWIAYLQPHGDDLVVVRPDGSDRRQVAARASDHGWSPDSTRLAYVTGAPGEPESRVMTVRRDGTDGRELAEFAAVGSPAYSPSGRHVAFSARTPGGALDIWRVELADGSLHQLTDSPTDDLHPAWTADEANLAFSRKDSVDLPTSPSDVFWVNISGGAAGRITDSGSDYATAFAPGLTMRLAGADRVHTAVELSRTFPTADAVVIARADDHPDALAGGPLAGALHAPLLLTQRSGLHPSLPAELARLGATRAYLLGGHGALSSQVEADLADAGVTDVVRLAGADRFETAAAVAEELRALAGTPQRVFVVEGQHADPARGWPDALSASGLATLTGEPILFATRDRLPAATIAAVQASGADQAVIVGGTAAVSAAVEARLDEHVEGVERVAGAHRYETSARVADLAVEAGAEAAYPWLATGRNWPDALAAAPAAVVDGGVLLLVDGSTWELPIDVEMWLTGVHDPRPQRAVIVGGAAAVSPATRTTIQNALVAGP